VVAAAAAEVAVAAEAEEVEVAGEVRVVLDRPVADHLR
jgi:hypothetical protein